MIPKSGRYGLQPALALINTSSRYKLLGVPGSTGRIAEAARLLGVEAGTLRAWLTGSNVAPAEYKLRLAEEVLGVPIERCWTAEYLATVYVGPRGGHRSAEQPMADVAG